MLNSKTVVETAKKKLTPEKLIRSLLLIVVVMAVSLAGCKTMNKSQKGAVIGGHLAAQVFLAFIPGRKYYPPCVDHGLTVCFKNHTPGSIADAGDRGSVECLQPI